MSFLEFELDDLPDGNSGSFEPLPAGWYTAKITEAVVTPTKAGTGEYIKMRLDVTGPTHEGRVVFCNINVKNPNPTAEEIGRGQLKAIMLAMGLPRIKDTDQLIGGAVQIKLNIKHDEQYGDSNEVKAFKSIEGSMPPAPKKAPASSGAPASNGNPPWAK